MGSICSAGCSRKKSFFSFRKKKHFSTKERVSVFLIIFSGEVHHLGLFEFEMRRYLFLPLLYGRGEGRGRRSILPVCQLRSFRRRRRRNPFFTQQEASSSFSFSLSLHLRQRPLARRREKPHDSRRKRERHKITFAKKRKTKIGLPYLRLNFLRRGSGEKRLLSVRAHAIHINTTKKFEVLPHSFIHSTHFLAVSEQKKLYRPS